MVFPIKNKKNTFFALNINFQLQLTAHYINYAKNVDVYAS